MNELNITIRNKKNRNSLPYFFIGENKVNFFLINNLNQNLNWENHYFTLYVSSYNVRDPEFFIQQNLSVQASQLIDGNKLTFEINCDTEQMRKYLGARKSASMFFEIWDETIDNQVIVSPCWVQYKPEIIEAQTNQLHISFGIDDFVIGQDIIL